MNFNFFQKCQAKRNLNIDIDILYRENETLKRKIALLEFSIVKLHHTSIMLVNNNDKLIEIIENLKKQ